jgi:hypothetical protein
LPQQAEARSSQGRANGNFFVARGSPCQQQVSDIRAGHQQDEAGSSEQQEHSHARASCDLRAERLHIECKAAVSGGIFLRQRRRQGAHLVAAPLR